MGESQRLENFLSKFTAYAAHAGIMDDGTKREELLEKITKALREGVRPHLDLIPTFVRRT